MEKYITSLSKIFTIIFVLFFGGMGLKSDENNINIPMAIQYDMKGNFKDAWEIMNKCQFDCLSNDELMLMTMYCQEGRKDVEKDPTQAQKLFKILNEKLQSDNSAKSLYYRGLCEMYGDFNFRAAYKLIQQAADNGYSNAQVQLAIMLLKGIGVKADPILALSYLDKAVAQNNLTAKAYLASYYLGKRKNLSKGIALAQESSNAGNRAGQYTLAMAYEKGVGIKKNEKKALKLYQLSADQGLQDARERLVWLKESLNIPIEQYIENDSTIEQ